jgi:di/tricarboxylate transporter
MAMPALVDWTRKRRIAASMVLLPLSYGAILGGVCTLIGTSTNLVVHGLMKASGVPGLAGGLGMWELAPLGVPIAVAGMIYIIVLAPRMLPERKEFLEQLDETRREYLTELIVERGCPLIDQTVQQAGLRHLPGLFLIEIDRGDQFISPVEPDELLRHGDRLVFTGVVSTIVDLQKIPALVPAAEPQYEIDPATRRGRRLCEAVISVSSPLVGIGVREANFRGRYNAAVVAVHRNGRRLNQKIGDIRLQPGDTLLLETGAGFVLAQRNNPGFYLVSEVGDTVDVRHERAWIAAAITFALIAALTAPDVLAWIPSVSHFAGWMESQRVTFAMLAAGLMVVTRCLSAGDARRSIEWSVLLMIAASFGVGAALKNSGAAARIAETAVSLFNAWGPVGVLAGIYIVTWILTELMSNNAAAALMFPVAVATAAQLGIDPRPYAVAITIAASGGFLFPAGYQTHLMVFGPGGYKVSDFIKIGVPMVVLWFVLSMLIIPRVWPLVAPV